MLCTQPYGFVCQRQKPLGNEPVTVSYQKDDCFCLLMQKKNIKYTKKAFSIKTKENTFFESVVFRYKLA